METIRAGSWDTVIVVYKWDDEGGYAVFSARAPDSGLQWLLSNAPVRLGVLFFGRIAEGGNVTTETQYSNKCRADRARADFA
jgi:hypothetical protein